MSRPGIPRLAQYLEHETDFFTAPASRDHHGAWVGGLVEHSLAVYDRLKQVAPAMGISCQPTSLIMAALLHDVCKAGTYIKVRKSKKDGYLPGGKIKWVDVEGWDIEDKCPLGHGEKSVILVQQFVRLEAEEVFAIRWHMCGFDDAARQYGGGLALGEAMKKYPLIIALHAADLAATFIDGK